MVLVLTGEGRRRWPAEEMRESVSSEQNNQFRRFALNVI